jgi:hypothetical protein
MKVLLLALFALASVNALELTKDNFDKEITSSGKNALVKFLAPW